MLKTLVAIKNCRNHAPRAQQCRQTWLLNRVLDYRFFVGKGNGLLMQDVAELDCADDYASLPFKTQAICRWAMEREYDFIFLCDDDTYCCVPRLMGSDFHRYDYTGWFVRCVSCEPDEDDHCTCVTGEGLRLHSYASGGSGYWLSRRSMGIVAAADFAKDPLRPDSPEPSTRGEDLQVGWALGRAGVKCHRDFRYSLYWPGPRMDNTTITLHNATQFGDLERLHVMHRAWLGSGGH